MLTKQEYIISLTFLDIAQNDQKKEKKLYPILFFFFFTNAHEMIYLFNNYSLAIIDYTYTVFIIFVINHNKIAHV